MCFFVIHNPNKCEITKAIKVCLFGECSMFSFGTFWINHKNIILSMNELRHTICVSLLYTILTECKMTKHSKCVHSENVLSFPLEHFG